MKKLLTRFLYSAYRVLDPLVHFRDVAILAYHSISGADDETTVSPEMFERQLAYLIARGHSFVTLADIVEAFTRGAPLPRKAVAITFDDGYADFETKALSILKKFNAPATVFVMSDRDASRKNLGNGIPLLDDAALARLKADPSVEIGAHGATHANVKFLKGDVLQREVARPEGTHFFAFAGGSYSYDAIRIARDEGFSAGFSIKPGLITKRGSNLFLLQRNVILRGMTPQDVEYRTTRAVEWYAKIMRFLKPKQKGFTVQPNWT